MDRLTFQSTPLIRGETCQQQRPDRLSAISIHSPHTRGDSDSYTIHSDPVLFQSTPLIRGETTGPGILAASLGISIHSPHTRGDLQAASGCIRYQISIHSPHTRGDCPSPCRPSRRTYFNPLPSCEGRLLPGGRIVFAELFQSTPLTRGETAIRCGYKQTLNISIRSPLTRGDLSQLKSDVNAKVFQSTPLMRWETVESVPALPAQIHFNPLPSHEGRQHKPPKIHPDLRQLTQQNHDTPLFGALQAPFCGAEPDIRGAKPTGKP